MRIVAATPIRVRRSRIFEAALVYANVSPPEITSTDPIKVSCQSIASPEQVAARLVGPPQPHRAGAAGAGQPERLDAGYLDAHQ